MKVGDVTEVLRTPARVPDPEARVAHRDQDPHLRRGARRHQQQGRRDRRSAGERMKYLERLRAQATITWRNDELKKAYEQALAERRKVAGGMTLRHAQGHPDAEPTDDRRLVVRALDAVAPRAGGARAARTEADRGIPADGARSGAAGRIARRRSTGRCFPATASRASTRATGCPS